MSLFFLGSCRHACLKKNSASPEKDPTFDTISTQTGFQNNESLCYICVEMLATLGSQWHPECSIFARKMLQDATVNEIRNALEDQRKAAYRKYPVFTMPRHSIERPWESRRFPGGSPGGHRRDPRELKGTRRAQEGTHINIHG